MNCPHCGATNPVGAGYCSQCHNVLPGGAPVGAAQQEQPGAPPRSDFQYDLGEKKSVYDHDGRMIGAPAGKPVAPKKSRTALWIGLGIAALAIVVIVVIVTS